MFSFPIPRKLNEVKRKGYLNFNENDNLNPNEPIEVVILDANGEQRMLNVERDIWHSLVCLESGSVLYESKDGLYHPLEEDEVINVPK